MSRATASSMNSQPERPLWLVTKPGSLKQPGTADASVENELKMARSITTPITPPFLNLIGFWIPFLFINLRNFVSL